MDVTFDPPRSGIGSPLGDLVGWSQQITLTWVNPQTLAAVLPGQTDTIRVEVTVSYQGTEIFTGGWLVIGR